MIIPVSISMWNKDVERNLVQYTDVDTESSVVNIGEVQFRVATMRCWQALPRCRKQNGLKWMGARAW